MWSLQTKISEIKYANHFLSWLTFFHDQLLDYWNEAFNQLHLDNIDYQHFVAIAGWRTGMSGTAPRSFHGHWPGVAKSGGWHSLAQKNDTDRLTVIIWRDRPFLWNQQNLTGITCLAVRKVWNPDCSFGVSINAIGWHTESIFGCRKLSSPATQ